MITRMRRMIKGKAAKTLLFLIIAAVGGLFTLPLIFKKTTGDPWVAKVNGQEILYQDFARKTMEHETRVREMRAQYGQLADMLMQSMGMTLNPRKMAYNQLVREELVDQLAEHLELHLDDDFIDQMLGDQNFVYRELSGLIPPQLIDPQYGINTPELRRYLQRMGLSLADLESIVEKMLKRSLTINLVLGASHVSPAQVQARYMQQHASRSFSVLTFDFTHYLDKAKKETIDDEQLKQYFDTQNTLTKRYWEPEKRAGKVWEFDADSYGVTVDKEEIQAYYDDYKSRRYVEVPVKMNVRHILLGFATPEDRGSALEKATALHAQLKETPSLFAQKAKELSQDKETAKKGGLVPEFARGTHPREFEKAAFLLERDGDISSVVQTDKGFHIVQRVSKVPAKVKPFSAVQAAIKSQLSNKKFKDQFFKRMKQFMDDDATMSERDNLLKKARKSFDAQLQPKTESKLSIALFRARDGQFNFYTQEKKAFIVQTNKVVKRHLPSIDSVEATVKGDLQETKAAKALAKELDEAYKKARPVGLEELKKEFGATLSKTGILKLGDAEKIKALRAKGFPLEAMMALEKKGSVGMDRGAVNGHIFVLETIEPFDQKAFADKETEIRDALEIENSGLVVEALVAFLHRKATIEVNHSIIDTNK